MSKSNLLWLAIGILALILVLTTQDLRAIWIFGVLLYFLPCFIAKIREKRQKNAIMLLNLLLGWTVLGWIAALIWSVIEERPLK